MVVKILILSLIFGFSWSAGGQNRTRTSRQLEEAKAAFQVRNYERAISAAQRGLQSDSENPELILLLAEVYHELKQPEMETVYLVRASRLPAYPSLVDFRLGEAYFKSGNYESSFLFIEKYLAGNPSGTLVPRAERIRASAAFAKEAIKHPVGFEPMNMGDSVNTLYDEYWPSLTVDGATLVFTRLLPVEGSKSVKQEDFFISRADSSVWSMAQPMQEINTPLNEGAQTLSADGTLLFFTRCNHPDGFGSCDIWFSRLVNGSWTLPRNAGRPLNTQAWEGQPSLSAFGDVLYFSSNRPGGKGNKDIWSIDLMGWRPDGLPFWGEPVNLGDSINTSGDEISPFIHPNNIDLFFASDYWPGFGGFDLFRSYRKPDGEWITAKNLGYPVNTTGNEQGLVIERRGVMAYLASNRDADRGMDIYTFELDEALRPDPITYIRGKVVDRKTGQPVSAAVQLKGLDLEKPVDVRLKADHQGLFTVALPSSQQFAFLVNEPGYLFYSEHFMAEPSSERAEPVYRNIELIPVEIGQQTHLHNIFYETGSHVILPQSLPELETLVHFLSQNRSLEVEIQGHTDNVGDADYNMGLSERRALSVLNYLTGQGVGENRLTSAGYGYSMPVDTNETEAGRARNRRTTIRITGVLPHLRE
jgi:outer membrane protein OmpA-like peptidoglycan-associated protein